MDDDVVIWYQPRVRCWLDKKQYVHIAGEPDGFERVLERFRVVARRVEDEATVNMRVDPIPKGRNPVAESGVHMLFDSVTFVFDASAHTLRAEQHGSGLTVRFSEKLKYLLGYAITEAFDGEGDFSIPVELAGAPTRLWFWGFSNPHGVNSF